MLRVFLGSVFYGLNISVKPKGEQKTVKLSFKLFGEKTEETVEDQNVALTDQELETASGGYRHRECYDDCYEDDYDDCYEDRYYRRGHYGHHRRDCY